MTPEAKVKEQVKALLAKYNAYQFMPVANVFTRAGVPDIVACLNSTFVGIECKAGKNKCTKLQELELEKIQQAGGKTFVARENNLGELEWILRNVSSSE